MKFKKHGVSKELIAFAYVQEEYARTGDIAIGLMPIFAPIIHECSGQIFNAATFAETVQSKYDIAMRPIVAESLIPKLVEVGLLTKEGQSEFVAVYRCVAGPQLDQSRNADVIEEVLNDFVKLVETALKGKGITISNDDLEAGFIQRLMDMHFLHVSDNTPSAVHTPITDDTASKETERELLDQTELALDILSAEYIENLAAENPNRYQLLESMVSGAVLVDVVLTLQQPSANTDLSNLTVVIDGPLIMDRLDLNTPEHTQYAQDLFDLLQDAHVKLVTFTHVVEEIHGSIIAPLESYVSGGQAFGPLAARFRREPGHVTYARAVLDGLHDFIANLDITVVDAKEYSTADYFTYCSEEIEDSIRNCLGPLHTMVERRIRDASSISSVMRMRKGYTSQASVTEAKYIFVTRSVPVALRSINCLHAKNAITKDDVPPCIIDRQLAGVLWFCLGGKGQKLTHKRLLANCMDALYPRANLLSSVRKFLNNTAPEKAKMFEALMKDKRAQRCLIHKTLGYASAVSQDNVEELFEEIKRSTAQEVEQLAQQRERALREEHEQQIAHRDAELSRIRDGSDRLQREKDALLSRRDEADLVALERACRSARRVERRRINVILIVYALAVMTVAYLSSKAGIGWWIYPVLGLVGLTGFWFVPEKLFKKGIDRAWQEKLLDEITASKIEDWDKRFDLNRDTCKVTKISL